MATITAVDARFLALVPFALVGIAVLVRGCIALRGTTLQAPCVWALVAFAAMIGVEAYHAGVGSTGAESLQWLAAALSLCPTVAVLGAKRPQNRAWQWIVASLAAIVAFPAFEALGQPRAADVHWLRAGFMLLLVLVAVANYFPTRYRWPAVLAGMAQAMLVLRLMGLGLPRAGKSLLPELGPVMLVAIALALAHWLAGRSHGRGVHVLWRDFRDAYGLAWGMRVAERLATAARAHHWPIRWSWRGPEETIEPTARLESKDYRTAHERMVRALLLRFVSPGWIASRCVAAEPPE